MIDCKSLEDSIRLLKTTVSDFDERIQVFNETGDSSMAEGLEMANLNADMVCDTVLESYADAFLEKNPELFGHEYVFSEPLENLKEVLPETIITTLRLDDGAVLVCGADGETSILYPNSDGKYDYSDGYKVDIIKGFEADIEQLYRINENEVLVYGDRSEMRVLSKGEDGHYTYSQKIADPYHATRLVGFKPLPDGGGLVCYSEGAMNALRKRSNGEYSIDVNDSAGGIITVDFLIGTITLLSDNEMLVFGQEDVAHNRAEYWIEGMNLEIEDSDISVKVATKISDDEVLTGGRSGELRTLRRNGGGHFEFSERIEGFGENQTVGYIVQLSDNEILASAYNGEMRILEKDEEGKYHCDKIIGGYHGGTVVSITVLSETEVLVCGMDNNQILRLEPREKIELPELKEKLNAIANKANA